MLLGFKTKKFKSGPHQTTIREGLVGKQLIKMLLILLLVLILHVIAMIHFEGMHIGDAIWLTMTSATTVGYGDLAAKTFAGRSATIILLYVGGIAILAQVAAMYFEYRNEIRSNMLIGNWSWKAKDHVVFLNCPGEAGEEFFYKAFVGMRESSAPLANASIIIVSESFKNGISDRLRKLNVAHVSKPMFEKETLESASIKDASTVVILSKDRLDPVSDSITFELVARLREMGFAGRIIAESVQDENRERLRKMGADSVLRPVRTYPEILTRAILAPGSEQVIETLFNSFGEECIRCEVEVESEWLDVIKKITSNDLGIPIAYEDVEGKIVNNPSSKKIIRSKAIFVIVAEGKKKIEKEIRKALAV